MEAGAEHLADEGLARRHGQRIIIQRDLLNTLRHRGLDTAAAKHADETGLPHMKSINGEHVTGTYRQTLTLSSGRFAMIDNGLGFQLVPWSPSLEKRLGQEVLTLVRGSRGADWSFNRNRGLNL